MKRCPRFGRDYNDDSMSFCLDDGSELLFGPGPNRQRTAVLPAGEFDETAVTRNLPSNTSSSDQQFEVTVLPFKYQGDNAGVSQLAEALTEDIVKGLIRFSYLKVVSDSKSDARYVIEGNIRQNGTTIRLSVQATDTATKENLWAEKYDLDFASDNIFEIQDRLAPQIVSTIADIHGVLPRRMCERLRSKRANELSPYEALVRSFSYFGRVTPDEWRASLDSVEAGLEKQLDYATLRAMRALLLVQGYAQGFDVSEESLELGASEARRAVEGGSDHLAWFALAQALFFKKEFGSLPNAVKRSLTLNPMDGNAIALFGEMVSYSGDWKWGLELAQQARDLNPNFPGWYWHANFNDAYRRREYQEALEIALRMNLNSNWGAHVLTAIAYGQLGNPELAARSWEQAVKMRPNLPGMFRRDIKVWFDDEHAAHLMDGLYKTGINFEG
ncbi:MAG: hypothetical protein KF756_09160 [Acidobacteria bacterium]|nr:hypothetical protein [Acidobacteriota bacterium]